MHLSGSKGYQILYVEQTEQETYSFVHYIHDVSSLSSSTDPELHSVALIGLLQVVAASPAQFAQHLIPQLSWIKVNVSFIIPHFCIIFTSSILLYSTLYIYT